MSLSKGRRVKFVLQFDYSTCLWLTTQDERLSEYTAHPIENRYRWLSHGNVIIEVDILYGIEQFYPLIHRPLERLPT